MSEPRCFISYSWESDAHKDWVRYLAEQLQANGVFVHLDQWDIALGDDLPHYMETSIRDSDFVLLICTPTFAAKANSGFGGVGYEKSIATGEIFERSAPNTKYIPLIIFGNPKESLPSYLKSKTYLDFRNKDSFNANLIKLLRHLHNNPQYFRPPIGSKPIFEEVSKPATTEIVSLNTIAKSSSIGLSSFKERFDFALNSLAKTTYHAEVWAKNNPDIDIRSFKERFDFALNSLAKTTYHAEVWAKNNPDIDIRNFKERFDFALNSLGKTTYHAEVWARQNHHI